MRRPIIRTRIQNSQQKGYTPAYLPPIFPTTTSCPPPPPSFLFHTPTPPPPSHSPRRPKCVHLAWWVHNIGMNGEILCSKRGRGNFGLCSPGGWGGVRLRVFHLHLQRKHRLSVYLYSILWSIDVPYTSHGYPEILEGKEICRHYRK
jgi:hypothetical protein